MHQITVLLAIQPRMLSAVVGGMVERQPDMDVVGEVSDHSELGVAIPATGAQVVIMTSGDAEREPGICRDLLAEYPQLKIMALSAAGDTAFLYQLGAKPERMDDVGEAAILSAIREFMR
ncbi:response regulator transcription factor [Stenomitos frigidus]|uniref:DNA-binding response regulator n=1 Tax=Stenomitos frigidus ULC18 TaxID=2107698 RepID=A0A2T1DWJ6_9CYAN|nr:response regulator transcription factor [Stenomitos frigidus]PSB24754.1 hypothetical protein C7B82_25420 [Stenomitos frigidus ULC18]